MTSLKHLLFAASIAITTLLTGHSANATQIFHFNGIVGDGDSFWLNIMTKDAREVLPNSLDIILADGHHVTDNFYGYTILDVSGTWFEANDPDHPLKIISLDPADSFIAGFLPPNTEPLIKHAPTDNRFEPISWNGLALGKFSYGGIAFTIEGGERYQLFQDPNPDHYYAGCSDTCLTVIEVDTPTTLPLMGLGLALVLSYTIRRRFS